MRVYNPELIPGLLQTEHYARAVIRAVRPGYDEESVERRVAGRLARQKALLDREASPELLCAERARGPSVFRRWRSVPKKLLH